MAVSVFQKCYAENKTISLYFLYTMEAIIEVKM